MSRDHRSVKRKETKNEPYVCCLRQYQVRISTKPISSWNKSEVLKFLARLFVPKISFFRRRRKKLKSENIVLFGFWHLISENKVLAWAEKRGKSQPERWRLVTFFAFLQITFSFNFFTPNKLFSRNLNEEKIISLMWLRSVAKNFGHEHIHLLWTLKKNASLWKFQRLG